MSDSDNCTVRPCTTEELIELARQGRLKRVEYGYGLCEPGDSNIRPDEPIVSPYYDPDGFEKMEKMRKRPSWLSKLLKMFNR